MLRLVIASGLLLQLTLAFDFGRSQREACRTMKAATSLKPEPKIPPFDILINETSGPAAFEYQRNQLYHVTLNATGYEKISQFMIQARRTDKERNTEDHIGYFASHRDAESVCRTGRNSPNVLVDQDNLDQEWRKIRFTWRAPSNWEGPIEFRVTLITDSGRYWQGQASRKLYPYGQRPTTPAPASRKDSPFAIATEQCGDTIGCYRHPKDCTADSCALLATWRFEGGQVHFVLSADTEGWVALGFSHDKKMGDDPVVECVWSEEDEMVLVRDSYNDDKSNNVALNPTGKLVRNSFKGVKEDGRIKCMFSKRVKTVASESDLDFDNNEYYVLLTQGKVDDKANKIRHELQPHKYPLVSPEKVSLLKTPDIHGRAKYPLVKAHGCLMLIAWMISASIAVILARYYKRMWPRNRTCGQKTWFAWHRGLMLTAMICTVIGFILIFIHAGGYSKMPDLPDKAHPILGIIVTILCILNPLIAACRCSPKHEKRPIFNWIHWFIGTIAHVLATPTLFIGLSLPKANVPWWATWVMVAFMLFHLLVELLLEIHGCINSRKQKERDMDFEYRKAGDPRMKESTYREDPVGTRFKNIIITMYLVVVLVLGLVMVITVIVS